MGAKEASKIKKGIHIMAEREPTISALPIAEREQLESLEAKLAFARDELKREQARLLKNVEKASKAHEKVRFDLAQRAAFGAFDVTVPNHIETVRDNGEPLEYTEVNYSEYMAARPAKATEGVSRNADGTRFYDHDKKKSISAEEYKNREHRYWETEAYYSDVMEKHGDKSEADAEKLEKSSYMALAREAAKARLDNDKTREQDVRELASQKMDAFIRATEEGDYEARLAEEMAHFDELIEEIPARLEKLAERRAAHAGERVEDAHEKPEGEGHPSARASKAETESSQDEEVETYLDDEPVEVLNSFESADGSVVVQVKTASGETKFVPKADLVEKEASQGEDTRSEAGRKLSGLVEESAKERLKTRLQGYGSEVDEDESSDEEEDAPAPKATDSVKADESESETKKDEPEAKPEKKKKFIPGNFHGTKRVSLVGVEQSGDEPGTVSVRDEEGNQYDIPREELLYLTEEPKVPGKELELYAGPRDDDSPKTPGKELELYTGNEDDHAEFGPLAPFVEEKEPKPFKVDSEGVVTDPEAKESVGDRAKSWFDRTRKVAGQKFWSGWERTKGYVLNIGTNPDMTPEQVESTQKRNRVRMTAGVQITGALLAAGLVFGGIAAVKGASANEGPEPTSVDSTPTPTPSSELYGTPGGSLYGTPDDESANTQEGEQ